MLSLIFKKEESGQTLEKYVKKVLSEAPLSFIYKLFRKKDVKINGHWQDKKYVISEGEEVKISNFGVFYKKERLPRKGTNPSSGAPIVIPANNTAGFRPSKSLKAKLNK